VLGLNSGTSLNSLDWALVELRGAKPLWKVIAAGEITFPAAQRRRLTRAASETRIDKAWLARADIDFGRWLGTTVLNLKRGPLKRKPIDLVASHGQTIGHWPGTSPKATLQIGDPDQLAKTCGLPVASHFRHGDLAVGGEGAPLTPAVNQMLFARPGSTIGLLNLGGIANLSLIPPRAAGKRVIGSDCGPANILLDAAFRHFQHRPYDRSGSVALKGRVDAKLLAALKRHPWFMRSLPASCGREEFGEALLVHHTRRRLVALPDLLATFCKLTGWSVARAVSGLGLDPDVIYMSGGGVYNRRLVQELAAALEPVPVHSIANLGVDPDTLEAVSFALLGYLCARGEPLDLCGATGSRRPAILGRLSWP
jgi:anhydro-N-acetylmuramic acid kinase